MDTIGYGIDMLGEGASDFPGLELPGAAVEVVGGLVELGSQAAESEEQTRSNNANQQKLVRSLGLDTVTVDSSIVYVNSNPANPAQTQADIDSFNSTTNHSFTLEEIINNWSPAEDAAHHGRSLDKLPYAQGEDANETPVEAYEEWIEKNNGASGNGVPGQEPWRNAKKHS
jgi:hypothetical protein